MAMHLAPRMPFSLRMKTSPAAQAAWTDNTSGTSAALGDFSRALCGHGGRQQRRAADRKDIRPGRWVFRRCRRIRLLLIIDSWMCDTALSTGPDLDAFQLYIDGQQVANELFTWTILPSTGGRSQRHDLHQWGRLHLQLRADPVRRTPPARPHGATRSGVSGWKRRISPPTRSPSGSAATTDQPVDDESFGIDNLTIVSTNDTSVAIADVGGADLLLGGAGDDTIDGGTGADTNRRR